MSIESSRHLLDGRLRDAVSQQLNASGPTGVFLSGGLDSSLLTAIATEQLGPGLPTFTVKFANAAFDESGHARHVARLLRTDHNEVIANDQTILDAFEIATDRIAEPISDPALLPTLMLAKEASESLKVVLSGEGADELFGGYPTYIGHHYAQRFQSIPESLRSQITNRVLGLPASQKRVPLEFMFKRFVGSVDHPWIERHSRWFGLNAGSTTLENRDTLQEFGQRVANLKFPGGVMKLDYLTYLRDQLLVKVDRATMAYGLEARSPFLDRELTRLAFTIPASFRTRGFSTKWMLKRVAMGYLPKSVVDRKKQGLSVPVGTLLNGVLRAETERLLAPEKIRSCGLLRVGILQRMLYEHRAGIADHGRALWAALTFQRWHERWVTGDAQ